MGNGILNSGNRIEFNDDGLVKQPLNYLSISSNMALDSFNIAEQIKEEVLPRHERTMDDAAHLAIEKVGVEDVADFDRGLEDHEQDHLREYFKFQHNVYLLTLFDELKVKIGDKLNSLYNANPKLSLSEIRAEIEKYTNEQLVIMESKVQRHILGYDQLHTVEDLMVYKNQISQYSRLLVKYEGFEKTMNSVNSINQLERNELLKSKDYQAIKAYFKDHIIEMGKNGGINLQSVLTMPPAKIKEANGYSEEDLTARYALNIILMTSSEEVKVKLVQDLYTEMSGGKEVTEFIKSLVDVGHLRQEDIENNIPKCMKPPHSTSFSKIDFKESYENEKEFEQVLEGRYKELVRAADDGTQMPIKPVLKLMGMAWGVGMLTFNIIPIIKALATGNLKSKAKATGLGLLGLAAIFPNKVVDTWDGMTNTIVKLRKNGVPNTVSDSLGEVTDTVTDTVSDFFNKDSELIEIISDPDDQSEILDNWEHINDYVMQLGETTPITNDIPRYYACREYLKSKGKDMPKSIDNHKFTSFINNIYGDLDKLDPRGPVPNGKAFHSRSTKAVAALFDKLTHPDNR